MGERERDGGTEGRRDGGRDRGRDGGKVRFGGGFSGHAERESEGEGSEETEWGLKEDGGQKKGRREGRGREAEGSERDEGLSLGNDFDGTRRVRVPGCWGRGYVG